MKATCSSETLVRISTTSPHDFTTLKTTFDNWHHDKFSLQSWQSRSLSAHSFIERSPTVPLSCSQYRSIGLFPEPFESTRLVWDAVSYSSIYIEVSKVVSLLSWRMSINMLCIAKAIPLSHVYDKGERRHSSYSFLTSALDGVEWSASRPVRALPVGEDPGTHWIVVLVSLRAGHRG
jgi:hypothetical protein